MVGAIVIVVVLLVVLPVAFMMSGPIVAALLGHTATKDAEARHEGSELIDLS